MPNVVLTKLLLILSVAFGSIAPNMAAAQSRLPSSQSPEPNESACPAEVKRRKDCEEVLDAAELAINRQAETIRLLSDQNERLNRALKETVPVLEQADAWYNNKWLWFGIGAVAGGLVVREARK